MLGRNHVAGALAVPLAGAMICGPEVLPATTAAWGGLILGSLAPDIDGAGSISYWGDFLPKRITPRPIVAILNGTGKAVSSTIRAVFGHRKLFHWPLWGLLLALAGVSTGQNWLIWFGTGYVLHICGDAITKSGVPLLGPIRTQNISFSPMKTGSWVEKLLGTGLWLFVGWQIWLRLPPVNGRLYQLLYRFGDNFLH